MNIEQLSEAVNAVIREQLNDMKKMSAKQLTQEKCGLDPRAFTGSVWYDDECLIVRTNQVRSLDYYGGFEYVAESDRATLGDYTVFSVESDRVAEVIDALTDSEDEDDV